MSAYLLNFSTGKLEPIAAGGLLPVGAVVTYEDRANPRKRFVVISDKFDGHGQTCLCEDGHFAQVSKMVTQSPGGWSDTGERLTADQLREFTEAAEAEGRRLVIEAAEQQRQEQARAAEARAQALATYTYLERVPAGQYAGAKHGAANIRTELKRAFPGHKFSVRSEVFAGGDSIGISWDQGPTDAEVRKITDKYAEGRFDGSEDIYEYSAAVFPALFGGAKYVQTHRSFAAKTRDACSADLCRLFGIVPPLDGRSFWHTYLPNDHSGRSVDELAHQILHADAYPAGADITGVEQCPERDVEAFHGLARFYRAKFTAPEVKPAAPAGSWTPAAGPSSIAVSYNADKGGIEIRFPAKPTAQTLAALKGQGWHWSRFNGCWYQTAGTAALELAAQIAGLDADARGSIAAQIEAAAHSAGARGMEEANGIA